MQEVQSEKAEYVRALFEKVKQPIEEVVRTEREIIEQELQRLGILPFGGLVDYIQYDERQPTIWLCAPDGQVLVTIRREMHSQDDEFQYRWTIERRK